MYKSAVMTGKILLVCVLMVLLTGCPEMFGGRSIQGLWYLEIASEGGDEETFSVEFTEEEVRFVVEWTEEDEELICSGGYVFIGTYTINSEAEPKEIDIRLTHFSYEECCNGDCESEEGSEHLGLLGIYDFRDGHLVLSLTEREDGRPLSFDELADFQFIALPASERDQYPQWYGEEEYARIYDVEYHDDYYDDYYYDDYR